MIPHRNINYKAIAFIFGIYAVAITFIVSAWVYQRGAGYVLEQIGAKTPIQIYTPEQNARSQKFGLYPRAPDDVVFAGDSITQNAPFSEYLSSIKNRGIGGDTTVGLLARLPATVGNKPSRFVLNIGTNDFAVDRSVDFVLHNINLIVKTVRTNSPNTKIFIISVLPININMSNSSLSFRKQMKILDLDRRLKLQNSIGLYTYVDIANKFSDGRGNLKRQLTLDGTHLNSIGNDIYIKSIAAYLRN